MLNLFKLSDGELQERCKTSIVTVTQDQAENVEKLTWSHAPSSKWNYFRSGHITASKFQSVCCTEKYASSMREKHLNFFIRDSGFYVSFFNFFLHFIKLFTIIQIQY